ncbi:hypothetical protein FH972_023937 [Carpinus fangiana]|uniref:Uncharacterized protein n=1 Tax=Carpinus fangiana TaxID=176857 RepID=A0A5N6KWM5_9ROSI|nr:hypothetical protein FH972_023937 [Carpinus fangiana]
MSARYVSSSFIKNVQKGTKTLAVEYVDKTTAWTRPTGFPSSSVKSEFAEVIEEHADTFRPDTVKVAMKESEHQSDKDKRMHYTAYELSKEGTVLATRHLTKNKESK